MFFSLINGVVALFLCKQLFRFLQPMDKYPTFPYILRSDLCCVAVASSLRAQRQWCCSGAEPSFTVMAPHPGKKISNSGQLKTLRDQDEDPDEEAHNSIAVLAGRVARENPAEESAREASGDADREQRRINWETQSAGVRQRSVVFRSTGQSAKSNDPTVTRHSEGPMLALDVVTSMCWSGTSRGTLQRSATKEICGSQEGIKAMIETKKFSSHNITDAQPFIHSP